MSWFTQCFWENRLNVFFFSHLLFFCFLIREMTCGSCDSLLTGINSGWSCYSILHLSAFFRLYDSLRDRPQTSGNFRLLSVYLGIFTTHFTKVAENLNWSSSARSSLEICALSRQITHDAWSQKDVWIRKKSESKSRKATDKVNNSSWS